MSVVLAWTMVVVAAESVRTHLQQIRATPDRAAFYWYSWGLIVVWIWLGAAYAALALGSPVTTIGPIFIRPGLVLLGALHIGRIRSWQRGEG